MERSVCQQKTDLKQPTLPCGLGLKTFCLSSDNVFWNSRKSDWHFFSGLVLNPPLNISVEKTSSSAIMIKWLPPPGSLKDVIGYKVSKIYRCFYLFNYLFILKFIFLGYSEDSPLSLVKQFHSL